jgi:DNA/RNA endonuclease YhcR with UshA esterase domain
MEKTKLVVLIVAALMLSGAVTAYAHHSFSATYQIEKKITIEGKVVQMMMRNPHSFIHVEVTDETGKPVTWSIEGGGATQMKNNQGEPLKVGDKVQVVCNPGRSVEAHRGRLVSITRPADGWTWGSRAGEFVD